MRTWLPLSETGALEGSEQRYERLLWRDRSREVALHSSRSGSGSNGPGQMLREAQMGC